MPASPTSFADFANSYVQEKKTVKSVDAPTPDQLQRALVTWAKMNIDTGWPLGTDDLQGTIDTLLKEYTEIWNGWYPPAPRPAPDNPLVYDFGDGSYEASSASVADKEWGATLDLPTGHYVLKNFPSGIMTYSPRWVKA